MEVSMRYLFVGGPARSGTSAFVNLLNCHPRIALGTERYKRLYKAHPNGLNAIFARWWAGKNRNQGDIGPHLFETERFFRYDKAETNIGAAKLKNPKFGRKFERATYRGDKVPSVMRFYPQLSEKIP